MKMTQSKFITNAEVAEFLNYSDLDAYEIENHNECEERAQGISPQEEAVYSSVQPKLLWNCSCKEAKKENIKHLWIEV
jgi:hypothetical protein